MKANRIHRFGSPCVICFEETLLAEPGCEEVLVRVKASGVGACDREIRTGRCNIRRQVPLTLGADLSGTIEVVGPGVQAHRVNDEVFGITNASLTGANAEYAIAGVDRIALKPRRLGHIEAASVPVVGVAAWQMLFDHAQVSPGQTVLVLGAAGNIGAFVVQLSRLVRARVIAVAGEADADYVLGLDADEFVEDRILAFTSDLGEVDAIIDTVGGEMPLRALSTLRSGGVIVSSVDRPDIAAAGRNDVRAPVYAVNVTSSSLEKLVALLDGGDLEPNVGAVLPLAEAVKAHEMLDGLRTRPRGKIVLTG